MNKSIIPFGMLFVEESTGVATEPLSMPAYDAEAQLSFVIDDDGNSVPFILWGSIALGATRTGMATKADLDEYDVDMWPNGKGI